MRQVAPRHLLHGPSVLACWLTSAATAGCQSYEPGMGMLRMARPARRSTAGMGLYGDGMTVIVIS